MMRRRDFITLLGGAAAAWPVATRAQQVVIPVVGVLNPQSPGSVPYFLDAFSRGLAETGYVEGQNVAIEYRWAEGRFDRYPELVADLVRRKVRVIAAPANAAALAAKAETSAIPIVFGVGDDPVKLGLVASLARPGGNLTGINFFTTELAAKRLGVLHELVPAALRVAVLANPANVAAMSSTVKTVEPAARALAMQVRVYNASSIREIDAAFAALVREQAEAVFVAPDPFFQTQRVKLAVLAARHALPAVFSVRQYVEAGGLVSYGASITDMYHQVGVYTGRILNGAKPADLPVLQSTKFELVINLSTAKAINLDVPPGVIAIADEVIE
jgi:putative tryptophan/tyrosine transport system substrate-binding protein